jgi:hypothetical protein
MTLNEPDSSVLGAGAGAGAGAGWAQPVMAKASNTATEMVPICLISFDFMYIFSLIFSL